MRRSPNDKAIRADRFDIVFCGHCPNAHLLFTNLRGEFICHATLSKSQCDTIKRAIEAQDPNFREEPTQ